MTEAVYIGTGGGGPTWEYGETSTITLDTTGKGASRYGQGRFEVKMGDDTMKGFDSLTAAIEECERLAAVEVKSSHKHMRLKVLVPMGAATFEPTIIRGLHKGHGMPLATGEGPPMATHTQVFADVEAARNLVQQRQNLSRELTKVAREMDKYGFRTPSFYGGVGAEQFADKLNQMQHDYDKAVKGESGSE